MIVKIVNIKGYEDSLREYLQKGDYKRPFIVAGWTSVGKTAIALKLSESYEDVKILDFDLVQDNSEIIAQIKKEWDTPSSNPRIICITTGLNMTILRDLTVYGCNVNYLQLDTSLWLNWARQKNPDTGLQNVHEKFCGFIEVFPDNLHQNIKILKEKEDEVEEKVSEIVNLSGKDNETLFKLLNDLFINQQYVYLDSAPVNKQWKRILDKLEKDMSQNSTAFNSKLINLIRDIAEKNSILYVNIES